MKKSIFTLALVAFFSVAVNAQTTKGKAKSSQAPSTSTTTTVNDDGTTSTPAVTPTPEKKEEAPAKKSGTRMAINEKGASSGVKPKGTSRSEDKKSSETPAAQPGSSGTKRE